MSAPLMRKSGAMFYAFFALIDLRSIFADYREVTGKVPVPRAQM